MNYKFPVYGLVVFSICLVFIAPSGIINADAQEGSKILFTSPQQGQNIEVNLFEGGEGVNVTFHLDSFPTSYGNYFVPEIKFPPRNNGDYNRISCYTGDGEGETVEQYAKRTYHSNPTLPIRDDHWHYCEGNNTHFEFTAQSYNKQRTLFFKAGHDHDQESHTLYIEFADPKVYRNGSWDQSIKRLVSSSIITVNITDDDITGLSPSPKPTVSLSITGNGSEGEDVTFGIESVPPPLTPLDVTILLDQTGGILADSNTGQRTITIPITGFASLTIPTIDDGIVDDNTITITILDGNGYTVGVPSSNTITIPDNDVAIDGLIGLSDSVQEPETPQPETPEQPSFTADPTLIANIKEYAAETYRGQEHVDRWHRVLKTLGVEEFPGLTTMTSGEAYTFVQQGWNRWIPVVAELKAFEAWQGQQDPPQPPAQDPPQQEPQQPPVNLISNGSFEAPIVTAHNGQWQQFAPSTAGISWTVTGDSLEIQRGILGGASDGSQHAELDAQGSVTISQTLSTVSGQAYEISFDYKARPNTASNTNGMNVTWNGVDIAPNLTLGNTWQTYTVNVTGTGSDTISFADAGTSDGIGTFLDNVSVMRTGSPPQ